MKAFVSQEQKNELLAQLKHHQELDAFIKNFWLDKSEKIEGNIYKGCFYGCTMQTDINPREAFSKKYLIDIWYCYITENIFENLPDGEYQKFPYESIDIIPVGFDFNKVKSRFFWLLLEKQKKEESNQIKIDFIEQCQKLFEVDFDKIDDKMPYLINNCLGIIGFILRIAQHSKNEDATIYYTNLIIERFCTYTPEISLNVRDILFQAINETKN